MDNYKIKVKDESSADEARDLFKKLGYHPDNSSYEPYVEWVAVFEDGSGSFYSHNMNLNECVEITIAQLQDLVVLKRNDVKDTNCQAERGGEYFITSDGDIYFWMGKWVPSTLGSTEPLTVIETNHPQDPALISGAEAKLAWANGVDIQIKNVNCVNWYDLDESKYNLDIFDNVRVDFRLKPQTIKVELELPKPFEPKVGDTFYYLNDGEECGYVKCEHDWAFDPNELNFGAYRTEAEVKQVVEQLRKIRGTNS